MSLSDQPEDIIINQLRDLSLQDLLNACQTNHLIYKVCQGRSLWNIRLIDDFKVRDLSKIVDPRSYYFSLLQERNDLLKWILDNYTEEDFEMSEPDLSREYRINSYDEFINSQRMIIDKYTEEQLSDMKILMNYVQKSVFYEPNNWGPGTIQTFFLEPSTGAIIYYTAY